MGWAEYASAQPSRPMKIPSRMHRSRVCVEAGAAHQNSPNCDYNLGAQPSQGTKPLLAVRSTEQLVTIIFRFYNKVTDSNFISDDPTPKMHCALMEPLYSI